MSPSRPATMNGQDHGLGAGAVFHVRFLLDKHQIVIIFLFKEKYENALDLLISLPAWFFFLFQS
jgi:hypothetical protein